MLGAAINSSPIHLLHLISNLNKLPLVFHSQSPFLDFVSHRTRKWLPGKLYTHYSQATQRWTVQAVSESVRKLWYRSVFESFIDSYGIKVEKGKPVKKLGVQACKSSVTYTRAALERLGVTESTITDEEIATFFDDHAGVESRIQVIWALRTLLCEAAEATILIDRCLRIREQGFDVELVSVVDPEISPRNMAILARKC